MADPLSVASGILALVTFAFQSSQVLYKTISSFRSNQRSVRELKEELEAIDVVLKALEKTAKTTKADFTMLEIPLRHCSKACTDFDAIILGCTAHSSGPRTSFRDWAKLRYMGDDIAGFKNMLAGYKSTIAIALGDVNLRTATITAGCLEEFKELIANTTEDLDQHLQAIDSKLQAFSSRDVGLLEEDATERQRLQGEWTSAQQCLSICVQVSTHIDEVMPNSFKNISTPSAAQHVAVTTRNSLTPAQTATAQSFMICQETMVDRTNWLKNYLEDISNRLKAFPLQPFPPTSSHEYKDEQRNIQEGIDSVKQCLAICEQASKAADPNRTNVMEDVSIAEDGQQVIVSTVGDLISAKRVTAGARSMQLIGQMSDASLQQLSGRTGQ